LSRACLPATFRLQGLATLLAAYSLRNRAGLISYRQRSWDSPFEAFSSRKVAAPFPARLNPRTVDLSVYPRTRRCRGRLDKPRFLGFDPTDESLAARRCLAHEPLVAPLGFSLPGPLAEALTGISPDLLSRASSPRLCNRSAGASECRSASAQPHPPARTSQAG